MAEASSEPESRNCGTLKVCLCSVCCQKLQACATRVFS